MFSKLKVFLILFALLPVMLYAQTGKIAGKVTDLQTGEPLISANVIVEGTSLGAATNANGEFIILNVSPGTYKLKARYIGYRESILENIRVSVNLTTEANFRLPSDSYQTETITITAPKPLINKNTTNATSIVKAEDIANLPIRGVNAVVSTQAGVVSSGANLYVRGSRADAVAYYIDGVLVNNPVFGGAQTSVISNAVEEIQFQAGGYPAEFGGANGGIISTQTRTGSENLNLAFEAITDNFMPVGKKYLGGYSYGFSEYVFTAGGPLIPSYKKIKFFVAANNTFSRTPVAWINEINFKDVYDPGLAASAKAAGQKVTTFDIYYPAGYYVNDAQNTYNVQGNLTYDLNPFTIRLNGSYKFSEGRNGVGFTAYNGRDRAGLNQAQTMTTSMKLTHVFNSNGFYDVVVNYFNDYYVDMDPIFKHNITAYGDSIENAKYGMPLRGDGQTLTPYQAYGFTIRKANNPYTTYRKQKTESMGGKANFLYQAGSHHELKFGGEYTYYIIRRYSLNPVTIASNARSVADGSIN
ncbi:MAG: carboxypeptidase-like regulatory domain-containing protein, partial [Bacillota bacterium]